MNRGIAYWKQELLQTAKKIIVNAITYTVKNIIASFVEEHLIKRPLKKIFSINKKWNWEEESAF
jgi:hypothetical protein